MDRLCAFLNSLNLSRVSDALQGASSAPVTSDQLAQVLPRLARTVGPAYLPIVEWQGSHFCLHLRPGRPAEKSPVVFCEHDEQGARFIADSLADLPRGMWLWLLGSHKWPERFPEFVAGLDALAAALPGGRPLPPQFHTVPNARNSRWSHGVAADALWCIADVGHPLAGLSAFDDPSQKGISTVARPFFAIHEGRAAEVLAVRVGVERWLDLPVDVPACLRVLSAESWRESDFNLFIPGMPAGEGLPGWDRTLSYVLNGHHDRLIGTQFEPLASVPGAYNGREPAGVIALREVARRLRAQGDDETALNQFRNAAQLQVLLRQRLELDLLDDLAEVCDAIEPSGLAADLTLAYANAQKRAP